MWRPEPDSTVNRSDVASRLPEHLIDRPVISSMLETNPEFLPIVSRFVDRLRGQLDAMDTAAKECDYVALAKLAHGLRGSGGSVGFDGFTTLAMNLEIHAKACSSADVAKSISDLGKYSTRVFAGWELVSGK